MNLRVRDRVRRLTSIRSAQVALGTATLTGLISCVFPLFNVHGVESAFALGLVLPFPAAVLGAALARRARAHGEPASSLLSDVAIGSFLIWFLPVVLLGLNQVRVRQCDPVGGLAFMFAGPGIGTQLAGVFGALVGAFVPKWPLRLAVLVPFLGLLAGLGSFWSTPSIAVYGQFVGWFPGTLYDVGRSFPMELMTYRLFSVALWFVAAMLLLGLFSGRAKLPAIAVALAASLVFGAGVSAGPELGHRSTVSAIDDALGGLRESERCVVHYPREMREDRVARLMADCDFSVVRAEEGLGVEQTEPVHAFFYRSASEKQRWMGAGRTFIAKPWRMEVHLQLAGWPHPVLGHEVVHVVARNAAQGPFQVSGQAGGWWPNPGLIEGVAVGIDWRELEGMTPHQWARAMRDLELLPSVGRLMGLGFLGVEARRSYTTVGSFTRFYRDTRGVDALRDAHREGQVPDLSTAADDWDSFLDTVELPDGAGDLARMRFSRSSIFATACPHRLATLRSQLGADLAAGDEARARQTCRDMLDIDEGALDARIALAGAEARLGRTRAATAAVEAMQGGPILAIARAEEQIADARWLRGDLTDARERYAQLMEIPQAEGARRLLEVKIDALNGGPEEAEIVRAMFLGRGGSPASPVAITHLAHELDGLRDDGLGSYLAARQLLNEERYALALPLIDRARTLGLPTDRLNHEASRILGLSFVALTRYDEARSAFESAHDAGGISTAERDAWLDRIAFLAR